MKFTKQAAFEKLKGVLTQNGKTPRMSDRSINDYVENLLEVEKDNEDLELDAFVAKYQRALISFNGNIEHEVSAGINDYKTEWEKKHPTQQPPVPPTTTEESPELKALMDRLAALETKNAELEKSNALKAKKTALLEKMKEKGIADDDWSRDILEQISISEDMDVDSKADSLLKLYNKTQAAPPHSPTTPRSTSQSGEHQNSSISAAAAAAKARREEQEKNQ